MQDSPTDVPEPAEQPLLHDSDLSEEPCADCFLVSLAENLEEMKSNSKSLCCFTLYVYSIQFIFISIIKNLANISGAKQQLFAYFIYI